MKVNGAWYIDALPNQIIIEKENGDMGMFYITPFRDVTKDVRQYNGYHPRKCKGQPVPNYLYRFYGLEKNEESLSEVIRIRVSPTQKTKIEAYAKNNNSDVSQVIRDYINGLGNKES